MSTDLHRISQINIKCIRFAYSRFSQVTLTFDVQIITSTEKRRIWKDKILFKYVVFSVLVIKKLKICAGSFGNELHV